MKKIIDIFNKLLDYILIPIMVFVIWIAGIFLGIVCLIVPFLERGHWWELFYMWPIGVIILIITIGMPIVFASKSFIDTIKESDKII